MQKKKSILGLVLVIIIGLTGLVFLPKYLEEENLDTRREASNTFSIENYQGMARFGSGRLTEAFVREQDLHEYDDYKFGWYFNWSYIRDWYGEGDFPVEIPESLIFHGLVGGWRPRSTKCEAYVKERLSKFPDSSILWVGNEIGWDDQRDPTTYARDYKSWYDCIKSVNPNLLVSPGAGVSPVFEYCERKNRWINSEDDRWKDGDIDNIEYLEYAMNDYKEMYGKEMPIDAYVTHLYTHAKPGSDFDVEYIKEMVIAQREFMKRIGHQNRPLLIKEMGFPAVGEDPELGYTKHGETMIEIYNMLYGLKDPDIGNPRDNYRLVQQWAWFNTQASCPDVDDAIDQCVWAERTCLFKCAPYQDSDITYAADCRIRREEMPLAGYHKQYVKTLWKTYDHVPPKKPDIQYEITDSKVNITFNSDDNGRINDYEISVGNEAGKADVMTWRSTNNTNKNNAVRKVELGKSLVENKYINVKSRDDGYNWSEVGSRKVAKKVYDFAPLRNPDGKVNILEFSLIINKRNWSKTDPRDPETDINKDGVVNAIDFSYWQRKFTE